MAGSCDPEMAMAGPAWGSVPLRNTEDAGEATCPPLVPAPASFGAHNQNSTDRDRLCFSAGRRFTCSENYSRLKSNVALWQGSRQGLLCHESQFLRLQHTLTSLTSIPGKIAAPVI
ncbi:hypothetical protein AAFF_G00020340 [Aldrovandia affinis]|uniref:Uncharacterized protein n=1 Tax=Aldrovandia affinis TaxID=143900 RepID=A0AAD7S562_9TELE|nr:hypothetical protein AAFF_G00020340 [Aldrovandia affinis]